MTTTVFTPEVDPKAFRDALGQFATGVTLVTIEGPNGPMGFTANSFASVSLDPPLVLWSPAKSSNRYEHFVSAAHYSIHVIDCDCTDWIDRFKRDGIGFDGLAYSRNAEGVPVIEGALARFDCTLHATHEGGDHTIVVGRVLRAANRQGAPLVFSQGKFGRFVIAP